MADEFNIDFRVLVELPTVGVINSPDQSPIGSLRGRTISNNSNNSQTKRTSTLNVVMYCFCCSLPALTTIIGASIFASCGDITRIGCNEDVRDGAQKAAIVGTVILAMQIFSWCAGKIVPGRDDKPYDPNHIDDVAFTA